MKGKIVFGISKKAHNTLSAFGFCQHKSQHQGKRGYNPTRYDRIKRPHLEHIAPQTPTNGKPVTAGYCRYTEKFKNQFIDCLGNYLLLSAPHNESIGNKPFKIKRESYNKLEQQREIQKMTTEDEKRDREKITLRQDKIVEFILENL